MPSRLRLMCVFAHPDDESLGAGGMIARYAAEGVEIRVITATLGQFGWSVDPDRYPGPEALGQIRLAELQAACRVLGVRSLETLDYVDGELDKAQPQEIVPRLAASMQRFRPDVVVTFPPDGAYGHPDHIAICQFTSSAIVLAAGPPVDGAGDTHRVEKFYYLVESPAGIELFGRLAGEYTFTVDDVARGVVAWPEWAITTRIESRDFCGTAWEAVQCHRSQLVGNFAGVFTLAAEDHERLWGEHSLYRVFSFVNGGRQREDDLFAGLRGKDIEP